MATGLTKLGNCQSMTGPSFGLSSYYLVTVLEYKKLIYTIIMQCLWLWPLKFMFILITQFTQAISFISYHW